MSGERISDHAVTRYWQRVDRRASRADALAVIADILRRGKARSRPRHWTRIAGIRPGNRYVYSADHPDICVVTRDGVAVTLFSRSVCRQWRRSAALERSGGRAGGGSGKGRSRRRPDSTPLRHAA